MTFDLDFADPRRFPPEQFAGLVVMRLRIPTSRTQVERIVRFLDAKPELVGKLWIVEETQARDCIPLPRGWPRRVRSAVIHTIALARTRATHTRAASENHFNERIRLKAENERLRTEILHLREEMRIKDSRMETIPPHRRPHYPPVERLAILQLRAARGWSQAQTAVRFLVSALTIAHWTQRLDEVGPDALVQVRFP